MHILKVYQRNIFVNISHVLPSIHLTTCDLLVCAVRLPGGINTPRIANRRAYNRMNHVDNFIVYIG